MIIVYCRGGDKNAPEIARAANMAYGIRHDYIPYAPVYMLDINWKSFDWQEYLAKVRDYAPVMAMTPDYEYPSQHDDLMRCIDDLKPLVQLVMVCPKFPGAIAHIPSWCIIAVSVPTSYAGYLPDFTELIGRRVHLLGGKPEVQADIIRKLRGLDVKVVSVDGSYHAMKAGYGQWFDGGQWVQVRGERTTDTELCTASAINIARYLTNVHDSQRQERLFL